MHLTDSHAHLDSYGDELPAVLARAYAAGVKTILAIGIGDGPETMHRAGEIAQATQLAALREPMPMVWASAGVHPQEADSLDMAALAKMRRLAHSRLCIAIGEIGLDYYHADNPEIPTQKAALIAQMQLAAEAGKPILIHCRTSELATPQAKEKFGPADAWEDLLTLLADHWSPYGLGGIMHCFSGDVEQARRSLDLGFYLSFAGNLTYPKATAIREAAAYAPIDRILVETDAPFLAPIPHRGERNEPALVAHTAAALAELCGIAPEALSDFTTANFQRLFPIAQR
jgi:TatD DNase family protein